MVEDFIEFGYTSGFLTRPTPKAKEGSDPPAYVSRPGPTKKIQLPTPTPHKQESPFDGPVAIPTRVGATRVAKSRRVVITDDEDVEMIEEEDEVDAGPEPVARKPAAKVRKAASWFP